MYFLCIDIIGSTFASAFKRVCVLSSAPCRIRKACVCITQVLLSRDEVLQLSAVQCIEEVLSHHKDYGKVLLAADIAGQVGYLRMYM